MTLSQQQKKIEKIHQELLKRNMPAAAVEMFMGAYAKMLYIHNDVSTEQHTLLAEQLSVELQKPVDQLTGCITQTCQTQIHPWSWQSHA